MIVVDASIVLTWLLDDEATAETQLIYQKVADGGAYAPSLWPHEIANGLRTAMRKKRIDLQARNAAITLISRMEIQVHANVHEYAWTSTLALSDKHNLTPYDAAYLDLALRLGLPLATLDGDLADAARAESVPVLP